MQKKLLCILCAGVLLLGVAACGTKGDKQEEMADTKKVSAETTDETETEDSEEKTSDTTEASEENIDETKTEKPEENKSLEETELNEYGVTDAQLQVFVDNAKAAITEEYLKPNNIDPANFSIPPAKVPMTEEDIQEIEEVFVDDEEKAAQLKEMGEKINLFWQFIVPNEEFRNFSDDFSVALMAGMIPDSIQPFEGDDRENVELAGVTDGWNLANILFREFAEWYKEVVCADEVRNEPLELIKQSESIETYHYNGVINQVDIGWYAFFADNISFE